MTPTGYKVLPYPKIRRLMQDGGHFVFDVTTRAHRQEHGNRNGWYAVETGFWKATPHLVLEEGFDYPEQSIFLDQAIVIEEDGKISVYRNWFQDYSLATITAEMEGAGFTVQGAWNDLLGTPLLVRTPSGYPAVLYRLEQLSLTWWQMRSSLFPYRNSSGRYSGSS